MGTGERCWPDVLRDTTGLPVVNLAEPGATVESAMRQASGIPRPGAVVIIEIGGNDLLGGTSTAAFEAELDALVQGLRSSHHDILMFELPLFPFRNGYGMAQRQVAAKYGVALLPKRCLTAVLGQDGSTLDGLHFSQEGHNAMAEIVARVLKK
jgi:acyl-CoA thioesterase-1